MENIQQNQRNRNPLSKMLFLIALYLFLSFSSSRYSEHKNHHGINILEKIANHQQELNLNDLATVYQLEQLYTGVWTSNDNRNGVMGLTVQEGDLQMSLTRISNNQNHQRYVLKLMLSNGQYIDQGILQLSLILDSTNLTSFRSHSKSMALILTQAASIDGTFFFSKLFQEHSEGPLIVDHFKFEFEINQNHALLTTVALTIGSNNFTMSIHEHEKRLVKLILFAVVIFIVAYPPFTAALQLLKQFFQGIENPLHYSLATVTGATMWDTVICLVAFRIAFNDQESLVLFILPAFILCLLFTNLEPRIMMMIFEKNYGQENQRGRCCSFNYLSYGSLIIIYPILILTNFNRALFLSMACLLFPQIYVNANRNLRPEIGSSYYMKFLLSRFLIIFYLRCFPYNVFALKPDYPLGILCSALLILQFGLLQVQNKYGPKIVVPKWMLEPVFDYNYEEAFNLEQGGGQGHECSICLMTLCKSSGPSDQNQDHPFRLMKTPCKHSYHSSCLISWMKIKMECPQCRAILPPYQ